MATKVKVTVAAVENIREHPNADRLAVCDVLGWQMVIPKDIYQDGDKVLYFPPDTLIPDEWADKWNVRNYLKGKNKDRVGKISLRGEPSFGLAVHVPDDQDWPLGEDVAEFFGATKWEPPVKTSTGDAEAPHPLFSKYTDIENLRNYPHVFEDGEEVVCTEKIHGTNSRVGLIDGEKVAGSMELRRKFPYRLVKMDPIPQEIVDKIGQELIDQCPPDITSAKVPKEVRAQFHEMGVKASEFYEKIPAESLTDPIVVANTYWFPWTLPAVQSLLTALSEKNKAVAIYGEVYGSSVQSLHYGVSGIAFRAFDLMVDGRYVNHDVFRGFCEEHGVETVPVLYRGPYSMDKIRELSGGGTTLEDEHIREGIVIHPVEERTHPDVGRLKMKYLSDAYLLGKHSDFKDM